MAKGKKTVYTDEQVQFVKDNCTLTINGLHQAFCERFGRHDVSKYTLKALRLRHGWRTGRDGKLKEGHTAWNKGKSYNVGGRSEQYRFKKGQIPMNLKELGSERMNRDGYVQIKVPGSDRRGQWVLKHRHVWEQENGPVPDGHAIIFRDNDKQNCAIDNLMLVSRGELVVMAKCGLHKYTGEAKDTALLMAKLKIKQRERLKQ